MSATSWYRFAAGIGVVSGAVLVLVCLSVDWERPALYPAGVLCGMTAGFLCAGSLHYVNGRPWFRVLSVLLLVLGSVLLAAGILAFRYEPISGFNLPASEPTDLLVDAAMGFALVIGGASAPLHIRWMARINGGQPHAYAVCSMVALGSLCALGACRVALDFGSELPPWTWAPAVGLLLLLHGVVIANAWSQIAARPTSTIESEKPNLLRGLHWAALAAVCASLLLALPTYVSVDLSPVPLIWIFPLAMYLAAWVMAFCQEKPDSLSLRVLFSTARLSGVLFLVYFAHLGWIVFTWREPTSAGDWFSVSITGTVVVAVALLPLRWTALLQPFVAVVLLFFLFWAPLSVLALIILNFLAFYVNIRCCCGELVRQRPADGYLTQFFFWIGVGSLFGVLFNELIAPAIFPYVIEYPLALILACMLRPSGFSKEKSTRIGQAVLTPFRWCGRFFASTPSWVLDVTVATLVGGATLVSLIVADNAGWVPDGWTYCLATFLPPGIICLLAVARPVRFGLALGALLAVNAVWISQHPAETEPGDRDYFGTNWESDPHEKLSYYSKLGPIGQVFRTLKDDPRLKKIGVVGLGTSSLATYSKRGQDWTFFF